MHSSTQPQGVGGHHGTPGAPPHEQVCWTYLNSLPGYADGTSPSNWLNDKGVARPGCFLRKPITHTCAFRRARKTAPDVVKGSPNPGCSLERKLSQKRNLDSTPPKGTRLWGRSLNTGSTVKCQFNAMTRATSLAKIKYRSTIRRREGKKVTCC